MSWTFLSAAHFRTWEQASCKYSHSTTLSRLYRRGCGRRREDGALWGLLRCCVLWRRQGLHSIFGVWVPVRWYSDNCLSESGCVWGRVLRFGFLFFSCFASVLSRDVPLFFFFQVRSLSPVFCWVLCGCGPRRGGGARWRFELPHDLLLAFSVLEFGFLFTGVCVCGGLMIV